MFGRPRCREWTPLATQQLRLRTLIQIVGYNIRPPEHCTLPCSFYITLHHTTMSAPFYTSERVSSPHPKWKEIDSEITQRMSSTNIVIRIWSHISHPDHGSQTPDSVLQTWGVYLSGLRYIGANLASNFNSDCFKSNTLVFQMLGGYFCSYKSLKLDIIPPENELEHGSLSSDSSGRTNLSKIILESRMIVGNKPESRSISPNKHGKNVQKEYSKSHSPVERCFQQNFPTIRNSSSLNITQKDLRTDERMDNFESYPDNLDIKEFTTSDISCDNMSKNASQEELSASKIDLSETAENYDLRNESDGVPKYRYLALNFLKSEIRPSYNATKLQRLHLLQYSIKKRQEAVQEVKERIYKKSALNDVFVPEEEVLLKSKRSQRNLFSPDENEELNKEKCKSQSDLSAKNGRVKEERPVVSNGPRLTLKLNDLLSYKAKPSPYQRSEHVRLTKQLEILRFKRLLLADERDTKLTNIRRLKERHAKLAEENQDVGTELMESYHWLSRGAETARDSRRAAAARRDRAAAVHAALTARRAQLLTHLHHIFHVQHTDSSWSICGVPFPVCGDECPRSSPASDSVAAGLVAQATCLAAAILNQPLRYKITLLGSASKILDVTPDLPDPNIPLFARGGDITLFRYAIFLLNKNLGQLCAGRGLHTTDIRPTLYNLQRLLTAQPHGSDTSKLYGTYKWLADSQCPRTQSLRSLLADRKYRQFNRFKDAIEGPCPQPSDLRRHRHSRSVGNYHDDQEIPTLDTSTTSIMGSESNIYNMKLTDSVGLPSNLKSHNSDSEISRMSENADNVFTEISRLAENQEKVVFTLGDDDRIIDLESKLVRLSTNNDDELTKTSIDDNFQRICSEITDFCSKEPTEIHEGFDVVKYMEGRRESVCAGEIEEGDRCVGCESERDGDCQLECAKSAMEVIVIPSAEAILDTGQNSNDEVF